MHNQRITQSTSAFFHLSPKAVEIAGSAKHVILFDESSKWVAYNALWIGFYVQYCSRSMYFVHYCFELIFYLLVMAEAETDEDWDEVSNNTDTIEHGWAEARKNTATHERWVWVTGTSHANVAETHHFDAAPASTLF
jgi:hypothetical protein